MKAFQRKHRNLRFLQQTLQILEKNMLSIITKVKVRCLHIPLIFLIFSMLTACTSVSMMAPYDTKTDQRVETFIKSVNSLLFQLEELDAKEPECSYAQHADSYRDLKVQLQIMDMHEQAKPNNTQTQKQIKKLRERLSSFITDHKRTCQPAAVVNIVQLQINAMLGHILKLERSKNGDKPRNFFVIGQKK